MRVSTLHSQSILQLQKQAKRARMKLKIHRSRAARLFTPGDPEKHEKNKAARVLSAKIANAAETVIVYASQIAQDRAANPKRSSLPKKKQRALGLL